MNKNAYEKIIRLPVRSKNARLAGALVSATALLASCGAAAFQIDSGNPDIAMSWDNTVKYSAAWRLNNPEAKVAGDPTTAQANVNDGDRNFKKGLISNRFDLLSEFEVRYRKDFGARVSGAAWYDDVYEHGNDGNAANNPAPNTFPLGQFPQGTKNIHGSRAEILDAFLYGNFTPAEMNLNVKAGRYTQLYGESLFFGSNGIAGAQTPLDLARALSVPNSQFKEVARPVGQASFQLQISPTVTLGGYYQYEWLKSRLPGSGSYFSFADFVDAGGNLLYSPFGPLARADDLRAKNSGQGGMQIKIKANDTEYGFYAARFHDKMPQFYVNPVLGTYALGYKEGINTIGASVSTVLGDANVAAEMSFREHMPLVAGGNIVGSALVDGRGFTPLGKTMHLNISTISVFGANSLWEGASFVGEIAYNRVMSVTDNAANLDPNATRSASALQFVFQPEYFQVLPGLDLQVPIGLSYGISGRSSVNGALFPSEHGGNISIGLKGEYEKTWQTGLTYTHYYGPSGPVITPAGLLSYNNFHGDRDFVSLSIQRSF